MLSDTEAVRQAIVAATNGNVSAFARLLGVDRGHVFRWRAGTTTLPPRRRAVCDEILADPETTVARLKAQHQSSL